MKTEDIAEGFQIHIFSQDVDLGVDIKLKLKNKNYHVDLFSDHSNLLNQFETNPAHIIILDISTLIMPITAFFEAVLKVSNEVRIVIISSPANISALSHYTNYNLYGVFNRLDQFVVNSVCNACDLLVESIYRTYQNEHILNLLEQEKKQHIQLDSALKAERSSSKVRPYQLRIAEYKSCQSKEELLDIFYKQAELQSWIYLKYIPTIETFISVSSHQVPENWTEGLSFKVPPLDKNFHDQIFQGSLPLNLNKYLLSKFNVNQIKFIPLLIKDKIEGLMISTQDITAESAEDFSLMSLVYANIMYESQPKFMDVEDQLTGFYNQLFYKRLLEKEIDRSKRTMSALSVIKISIDKFIEIESTLGKPVVDEIIKKIAELIKSTSRLPDYICRTGENEFTLLLVNCSRKGAVIRSERLRENLNKENYSQSGIHISISQGISEYPAICTSQIELDQSAFNAMKFISAKGGDKICLAKAALDHTPDFLVQE